MLRHLRSLRAAAALATACLAFVALLAPAAVQAWTPPTVTPLCAPDTDHFAFTVTLAAEDNYSFDWSFGNTNPWTTVAGHQGDNSLVVPRGEGALWVRWTSDGGSNAHATPDGTLCEQPSPSASMPVETESLPPSESPSATASASASPSGSVEAETGTPKITPPPTGMPQITPPSTDTVGASGGSTGSGLPMVLGAVSLLLVAALVATPSRKRSRR